MKIIMIWGQRKCTYPGQYAPELLEAVSENMDIDNPDIISNSFKKFVMSDEFESVQIMKTKIKDDDLITALSRQSVISSKIEIVEF